jgi:hypothetical protein
MNENSSMAWPPEQSVGAATEKVTQGRVAESRIVKTMGKRQGFSEKIPFFFRLKTSVGIKIKTKTEENSYGNDARAD